MVTSDGEQARMVCSPSCIETVLSRPG